MSKPTLGDAIALAAIGHQKQTDKGGKAYILHPMRMMMRLSLITSDVELLMICILHDWVEDCCESVEGGLAKLRALRYSERVVAGVDGMTRRPNEEYDAFIKRCAMNPDSKLCKREDLRDNSDITRLKGLRQKDFERLEKYSKAYEYLRD